MTSTTSWLLRLLHPAPFRDEQRGRLGRLPQRVQFDIFVEAVHRRSRRAEAQARNVVVQSIEPRVGQRGERAVRHRAAEDRAECFCERGFRFGGIHEFIAFREKARPFHLRRIVGEEAVVARGGRHAGQNFLLAFGNRPARQHRDPAIDVAPGRHAGRPVAALDDPGIEVERMGDRVEMAIGLGALVPVGLELLQRVDQIIGRHDRIGADAGLENVCREAAHLDAKPDHADLRADHGLAGRLRDEAGVGAVTALQGRERADAGALLLDHGLKMDSRGRFQAGGRDRIERIERADGARLHVAGAPAIHPAVLNGRRERRRLPHVERARRNDVAMALQDQRSAGIGRRAVGADHGARLGEIMLDRAEAAQILQIADVDMPVVDLVAALAQEVADHVLARPFGAAGRGDRNEILCRRQLRIETGVDGIEDFLLRIGVHAAAPLVNPERSLA